MSKQLLNNFFGCHSKINILRAAAANREAQTGRQIAVRAGLSPRSCQLSLDDLVRLNALVRTPRGRAYYYTLNTSNQIVTDFILPIIRQESRLTQTIIEALRGRFDAEREDVSGIYLLEQWPEDWGGRNDNARLLALLRNGSAPAELSRELGAACEFVLERFSMTAGFTILKLEELSGMTGSRIALVKRIGDQAQCIVGRNFGEVVDEACDAPAAVRDPADFFLSAAGRTGEP